MSSAWGLEDTYILGFASIVAIGVLTGCGATVIGGAATTGVGWTTGGGVAIG